jgi:DNA-binding FadR family transcriptional regulator
VGVPTSTPVTPPLDSSPRELLEGRRIIEPPTAHACAWRIDPPDVRRLAALIDDAERMSAEPGDDLHPFVLWDPVAECDLWSGCQAVSASASWLKWDVRVQVLARQSVG